MRLKSPSASPMCSRGRRTRVGSKRCSSSSCRCSSASRCSRLAPGFSAATPGAARSSVSDMDEPLLTRLVEALAPIRGVAAIVLGGSRGRGKAHPASDYDIGLYYEPGAPLDIAALRGALAPLVDDPP